MSRHKLVMGSDIVLEDTCNMVLRVLVGHMSYRSLCNIPLPVWVDEKWAPVLGYTPQILYLTIGWLRFWFNKLKDTLLILDKLWVVDGCNLMLK